MTAIKALYTTMLKNPYLAVTAAVLTLIAAYKDWKDSIVEVSQTQQDLDEVNRLASETISAEKNQLDELYRSATNKAEADAVRQEAIRQLNNISPEYLGFLNAENIHTQAAKNAIDAYTKSLLLNAKAKELNSKLDELSRKRMRHKTLIIHDGMMDSKLP